MSKSQSVPRQEVVAARAYQLWEAAGRPSGRDQEFWLGAEERLQAEASSSAPPPPPIPETPAHAVPPVIRDVVQPVARPPAPAKKRAAR